MEQSIPLEGFKAEVALVDPLGTKPQLSGRHPISSISTLSPTVLTPSFIYAARLFK
jgi:hypothetical protein